MASHSAFTLDEFWQDAYAQLPASDIRFGQSYFEHGSERANDRQSFDCICPLHQLGLLSVEGVDASTFLQGQLTADISAMSDKEVSLSAHCDPKGRMHANFYLYRADKDRFFIQLPISVAETALAALAKYAVFSKVTLNNLSSRFAAFGIINHTNDVNQDVNVLTDADIGLTIPGFGNVLWLPREQVPAFLSEASSNSYQWLGSAHWEKFTIEAGIGFVFAKTVHEFIPQMLNLDYLDGISFDKGCYTGQEIIARMKYRGKVKRRCFRFSTPVSNNLQITPGDPVNNKQGQLVGTVVNATYLSTRLWEGLVVLKVAAINDGALLEISSENTSGADCAASLTLQSLPYAITN